jgi:hypothetical protein
VGDGFEGDEAERFADARHHETVRLAVELLGFALADLARENHVVGEVHPARAVDELLEHAAVAGHHEPHVRLGVHDLAGDIEERHGVLLRGHAPEEEHERRVLLRLRVDDRVLVLKVQVCVRGVVAVVDDRDLVRVDAVLLHEDVFRVIAHGDDLVRHEETVAFLRRDPAVWLRVRAVEFRRVDVRHERHAVELRSADARLVGHPVVAVDHVGFEVLRHGDALFREAPDGLAEVGSVEVLDGLRRRGDGRRCPSCVHALGVLGETVVRLERARHEPNARLRPSRPYRAASVPVRGACVRPGARAGPSGARASPSRRSSTGRRTSPWHATPSPPVWRGGYSQPNMTECMDIGCLCESRFSGNLMIITQNALLSAPLRLHRPTFDVVATEV